MLLFGVFKKKNICFKDLFVEESIIEKNHQVHKNYGFLYNSKGRTVLSILIELAILQVESVYIPHTRLLCLHHMTQVKGYIQFEFL